MNWSPIIAVLGLGCSSPAEPAVPASPARTTAPSSTTANDAGAPEVAHDDRARTILQRCSATLPSADVALLPDRVDVSLDNADRRAVGTVIRDSLLAKISDREAVVRRQEYDAWLARGAPMQILQSIRVPKVPDLDNRSLAVVAVVQFEDQFYGTQIATVAADSNDAWFELDSGGTSETRALAVGDLEGDDHIDVIVWRPVAGKEAFLVLASSRPDTELSRSRSTPGQTPRFQHVIDIIRVSEACPSLIEHE